MASVFARVTYDYKGRYLLNAIMRRDGSSRFAKGHRWGFFPSFSAGYDIARTPYFQQLALPVSQLKVRVSYGRLGNQNGAGLYDYIAQMPLDAQGTNAWLAVARYLVFYSFQRNDSQDSENDQSVHYLGEGG